MKSKLRLLAVFLAAVLALPGVVFAYDNSRWYLGEAQFIPGFVEVAPPVAPFFEPFSAWNPFMPLPNRPLTPPELAEWNAIFCAQGVSHFERQVLRLTNLERAAHGLHPLTINYALSRAARFKSLEMLDLNYFNHASPVYGHWTNIPLKFISFHEGLGENLFALYNRQPADITPELFVQGWMNSPSHRANILHPQLTELGVGVVMRAPMGNYRNAAATQMFGNAVTARQQCLCPAIPCTVAVSATHAYGAPGDYVDIIVYLHENPGLIGLQVDIAFDSNIITATDIAPGVILPMQFLPALPAPAGQPISLAFETHDFNNRYGTGVLAVIRFQIAADATPGAAELALTGVHAISGDPYFNLLSVSTANGMVSVLHEVEMPVHISAVSASGVAGSYIDVAFDLTENPGLIGLQMDVYFDRSILTAVGITTGNVLPLPEPPTFPIPASQPLGLLFEAAGFENIYTTGTLATLRLRINPDANIGTTVVTPNGIAAIGGMPNFATFQISTESGIVTIEPETTTAPPLTELEIAIIALTQLMADAAEINRVPHTQASVQELEAALYEAEAAIAEEDLEAVTTARTNLQAAIDGLILINIYVTIDEPDYDDFGGVSDDGEYLDETSDGTVTVTVVVTASGLRVDVTVTGIEVNFDIIVRVYIEVEVSENPAGYVLVPIDVTVPIYLVGDGVGEGSTLLRFADMQSEAYYFLRHTPEGVYGIMTALGLDRAAAEDADITAEVTGTVEVDVVEYEGDFMLGDLTGNNTVTSADATLLARSLAGHISLNPRQMRAANINCDPYVDGTDLILLVQWLIGYRNVVCICD